MARGNKQKQKQTFFLGNCLHWKQPALGRVPVGQEGDWGVAVWRVQTPIPPDEKLRVTSCTTTWCAWCDGLMYVKMVQMGNVLCILSRLKTHIYLSPTNSKGNYFSITSFSYCLQTPHFSQCGSLWAYLKADWKNTLFNVIEVDRYCKVGGTVTGKGILDGDPSHSVHTTDRLTRMLTAGGTRRKAICTSGWQRSPRLTLSVTTWPPP